MNTLLDDFLKCNPVKITSNHLLGFIDRLPKGILWVLVLIVTALLGFFDYLSGFEISFAFFYLLPVSLSAWSINRTSGIMISVLCAVVWLAANLLAGEQFTNVFIPYWNALTRAGFFFVVTMLLSGLRQALDQERSLARTDHLTGTLNGRAFHDLATIEIERSKRFNRTFTVLYIDLDNFKFINDRYGHATGDLVLQIVSQTIIHNIRAVDHVARIGGDEFVILLPETNDTAAQVIAPRLRQLLLAEMDRSQWPVTFSIGALTCNHMPSNSLELLNLADQLMYKVKNDSKDAICYSTC